MALETPGAIIIRAIGLKITGERESNAVYRLILRIHLVPIKTKTHYVMLSSAIQNKVYRSMPYYYKNLTFKSHYKIIIIIINSSKILMKQDLTHFEQI